MTITRRQALATAVGLAAAPLAPAVASGPTSEETVASKASGLAIRRNGWKRRKERERNIHKGLLALLQVGFPPPEVEQVRKDICKITPNVKDHRRRFLQLYLQKTESHSIASTFHGIFLWHAIIVTFQTFSDGFSMLGLEDEWKSLVEGSNHNADHSQT